MPDKKQPSFWTALGKDAAKALAIGLATAAGTALVLFGLGALVSSRRLAGGLEAAKDGLFLVVALELFVLAGMLMLKGKKPEPSLKGKGWERHFQVLSIKVVLALLAAAWIAVASLLDYLSLQLF